jgi:hypothetical protein
MKRAQHTLARGIPIGLGDRFSLSVGDRRFSRLDCSSPWSREVEQGIIAVGKLAGIALQFRRKGGYWMTTALRPACLA